MAVVSPSLFIWARNGHVLGIVSDGRALSDQFMGREETLVLLHHLMFDLRWVVLTVDMLLFASLHQFHFGEQDTGNCAKLCRLVALTQTNYSQALKQQFCVGLLPRSSITITLANISGIKCLITPHYFTYNKSYRKHFLLDSQIISFHFI